MRSSRLDHVPAVRNGPQTIAAAATMTTIGFIGSGHIGSTVARLAVDAGHQVVLSNSRGPQTLPDLVDDLGPDRAVLVIAGDHVGAKGEAPPPPPGSGRAPTTDEMRTALAAAIR